MLMEADVEGLIGASRKDFSAECTTYRNDDRKRNLNVRLGALHLSVPKLRQSSYYLHWLSPTHHNSLA
jgi:putative transposase